MNTAFLLFLLASALALPQEARKRHKPSASLSPPGEFDMSTVATPTPKHNSTALLTTTITPTHKPTMGNTTTTPDSQTTSRHTRPQPTTANPSTAHPTIVHSTIQTKSTPPAPTPSTKLDVGKYFVKDTAGNLCVLAQMAIEIRMISNTNATGSFIIQPNKTHAEGSCDSTKANLTLLFNEGYLTFLFLKNTTTNTVLVNSISFNVNYPIISSGSTQNSAINNSVNLFSAAIGHCYSCKNTSVPLEKSYYVDTTMVQLQAFNFTNSNFGVIDLCPAEQADYRVAIAVGIVLLILIIIVVVAYFIGRRRRMDGYQTL